MTRDAYLDMCEQLGSEPIEKEIPIELLDLPPEAQEAWTVYSYLTNRVDNFSGTFLGKAFDNIDKIFNLLQVDDRLTCYKIVLMFDGVETTEINSRKKK